MKNLLKYCGQASFLLLLTSPLLVTANTNSQSLSIENELEQYAYISDIDQIGLDVGGDITIEAWVNFESLSTAGNQMLIAGKDDWSGLSKRQYHFKLNTDQDGVHSLALRLGHASSVSSAFVEWTPNLNIWYHLAVSRDVETGEVRFFVNGLQIGEVQNSSTLPIQDTTSAFSVGGYFSSVGIVDPETILDGLIDEVRIWNDVRSQGELFDHMNTDLLGNEENLVGYWNFNGTTNDSTSNGNHLILFNGPVFSGDVPYVGTNLEFPLYTQVVSEYPSLEETTEWADDVYAGGRGALGEYPCGLTISQCACAITSMLMSARNVGIEEDIVGGDVNPANMNSYLESIGGFNGVGGVFWLAAQTYFGEFVEGGRIASRFGSVEREDDSGQVMSFIDDAFAEGDKAVLAYKNGHFVWLPAKTDDSYVVNDPAWYETKTANDDAVSYVRDYDNEFDSARVFPISEEPVVLEDGMEAYVRGAAELLFENIAGDRAGYTEEGVVVDFEHASYGESEIVSLEGSGGESNGQHLIVYGPGDEFTLKVIGTGSGEYEVELFTISEDGEIQTFTLSGETIPGVTTTFVFNLETGEVTEQPITFEEFLAVLNLELAGASEQQRKFFLKWAEKIFENMEEKTVSQALRSIETFGKLLVAKKVESPVMVSVLDLLKGNL
jgi:hypothetical protein